MKKTGLEPVFFFYFIITIHVLSASRPDIVKNRMGIVGNLGI